MGLPRGRRWVDLPRRPTANASAHMMALRLQLMADTPVANDALAVREQLHRDADACTRRQGELRLTARWLAAPET